MIKGRHKTTGTEYVEVTPPEHHGLARVKTKAGSSYIVREQNIERFDRQVSMGHREARRQRRYGI